MLNLLVNKYSLIEQMNMNDKCHALHFIVERNRMLGHTCAIGHLTTIWYWDEMVDEKNTAVLNFNRDRQASTGKVVEVNASGPVYDTFCNRGMLASHPNRCNCSTVASAETVFCLRHHPSYFVNKTIPPCLQIVVANHGVNPFSCHIANASVRVVQAFVRLTRIWSIWN